MFSSGNSSMTYEDILNKISEADILGYYMGILRIPCIISSPFRRDTNPSFALYSPNTKEVNFIDFGTGDRGNTLTLLKRWFKTDYNGVINKLHKDFIINTSTSKVKCAQSPLINGIRHINTFSKCELKCKVREWKDYDIEYWKSYGVSLKWLKWCEVYPISHKFIIRDGKEMVFVVDKYAYAFVERKDNHITMKFYQPFNKNGFKWQNNNNSDVLGLWTKLPKRGKQVCICSSVKDSLCLMANTGIPCICIQAEGYRISKTATEELNKRFEYKLIILDNDEPGKKYASKLAEETGFINVEIPQFEGGKDISDYYKAKGENAFITTFNQLIIDACYKYDNELPF